MSSNDSGKTTSVSSTIQASSGFWGFTKFGNRSCSDATSSYGIGGNSNPVGSAASANIPHSPPDSEMAPKRIPDGHLGWPRISNASMNVEVSVTSMPPWWWTKLVNAILEPTIAPVWARAVCAAIRERPTFIHTTGFPASAQARRASAKASGRRTVSTNRPIALVSSSSTSPMSRSAASRFPSDPVENTARNPIRGPQFNIASAIDPDWAITETWPRRKDFGTLDTYSEPPLGTAMPMQLGPKMAAS